MKKNKYVVIIVLGVLAFIVGMMKINESKIIPDDVAYLVANSYMDAFNISDKSRMQMYLVGLDENGDEVWKEKYKTSAADANQFYNDVDGVIQLMTRSGKLVINEENRNVEWSADLGTDGKGNYIDPSDELNTWTNKAGAFFDESGYISSQDTYYQVINSALDSNEVREQLVSIENEMFTDGYSIRLYEDGETGSEYPVCYDAQSLTYDESTNNLYFVCPFFYNEDMALSYINLKDPKVETYLNVEKGDMQDELEATHEGIVGYITEDQTFYIEEDGYVKVFEESLFKNPDLEQNKVMKYQISEQGFRKIMSLNSNYSDNIFAFATVNLDKSVSVHYLDKETYEDTIIDLDYIVSDENRNTWRSNPPYVYIGDDYYIVTEPIEVGGGVNEYLFTEFDEDGNITNSFTHNFEYTEASSIIKL